MLKKDLGLFILILVVAAVVAFLNPRFLSQINLSNTANQIGLFGLFIEHSTQPVHIDGLSRYDKHSHGPGYTRRHTDVNAGRLPTERSGCTRRPCVASADPSDVSAGISCALCL